MSISVIVLFVIVIILLMFIAGLCVTIFILYKKNASVYSNDMKNPTTESSDYITGLLGRAEGERRIKAAMSQSPGFLAFIDLDNLKPINDTYGHLAGDKALKIVAEILTSRGKDAVISRIGGDEFLFFQKNMEEDAIVTLMETIINDFAARKEGEQFLSPSSLSIGLCLSTPSCRYQDVYQKADKALYFTKQHGKNGYHFYHHTYSTLNKQPSVDLARLVESIRQQGSYQGALGVEYREFTHLYEFITNMAVRYEHNIQLAMITLEPFPSNPASFSPEALEDAMACMNIAIRNSLRNVDVCTRFSSQQFLVILTNTNTDNISMIINRIFEQFYRSYDHTNIHVHYEAANLKE